MSIQMIGIDHTRAGIDVRTVFSFTKKKMAEALEVPLLGVVPEDEAVAACAQEGKFLLERADSRAAQAIERIAGRLLGEESDIPDVTRRSLWERLRGE